MKIVHVKWIDPEYTAGWKEKAEFLRECETKITVCESVGMLAFENDTHIVILQSVNPHETQNTIKIPKAAIISNKKLVDVDIEI